MKIVSISQKRNSVTSWDVFPAGKKRMRTKMKEGGR